MSSVAQFNDDPMGDFLKQSSPSKGCFVPPSEMQYVSAFGILNNQQGGTNWKFEGYVVQESVVERNIAMAGKRKGGGDKVVLDCVMVDRTGPVMVSLWDSAVVQFQRAMQQTAAGEKPLFLLQRVRIAALAQNDWNGFFVSPMKVLGSVASGEGGEGTIIQKLSATASPFNRKDMRFEWPTAPMAVYNFAQLRDASLPFRGTFLGTVRNLTQLDVNSNGQWKRDFDLVDEAGRSISCSAQHPHAKNTNLADNDIVVLYFTTGRRAGPNGAFNVFIFRDGFITKVGTMNPPPVIHEKVMMSPSNS